MTTPRPRRLTAVSDPDPPWILTEEPAMVAEYLRLMLAHALRWYGDDDGRRVVDIGPLAEVHEHLTTLLAGIPPEVLAPARLLHEECMTAREGRPRLPGVPE